MKLRISTDFSIGSGTKSCDPPDLLPRTFLAAGELHSFTATIS
jgi:hypothetical protein